MKNKLLLLLSFLIFGVSVAQIGVGNSNPAVNLDARAITGNSAIAFGNTNQTATAAGAGAMKYDDAGKQMYYSDGTNWVSVAATQSTAFIPKVVASGRTTVNQINFGTATVAPPFLKFVFGSVLTNDGNWSTSNNEYTVANNGIYQMSFAGSIDPNQGTSNAATWWVVVGSNRYNVSSLSNTAVSFGGGSISLYLTAGTTIYFGSSHCFGCGGNNTTSTATNTDYYTILPGNTFTITQLGT
ncbi:hypothetical protein GCM10023210_27180 [Chryseobacterium ginsengisoli]|uniref:C1q domain-containing protein n=1 Tax=Chryseobacterium ginsengisoli TaxID=363853 RepID=A0ABP9MGU7_9FLAO